MIQDWNGGSNNNNCLGSFRIFPMININSDQNQRRVDSNGNIFFPYVGVVKAEGTNSRMNLGSIFNKVIKYFKNPQLDLSISGFNSNKCIAR